MSGLVAVFADGDNLSACHAGRIIRCAAKLGSVAVARVYCNSQSLDCWRDAMSFQPVFSGDGKNAADVHLAIEATEYVMSHAVQSVVLCSSDADFVHLARFIRARGIAVVGMGEDKTKPLMRKACTTFQLLGPEPSAAGAHTGLSELDQKVVQSLIRHGDATRSKCLADVNAIMRRDHGTLISQTEYRNWRAYFQTRPDLYDLQPRGPKAHVRLRPDKAA